MDISTKLSVAISPTDATTLFKKAILDHLQTVYGITADAKDVDVRFKATMAYSQLDTGPGSPEFSGVDVTIKQASPSLKR